MLTAKPCLAIPCHRGSNWWNEPRYIMRDIIGVLV